MHEWPHGPIHRLDSCGTFMVTAGTYGKEAFFKGRKRLDLLQTHLFSLCSEHSVSLQAWAVFPNHYHFVARFERAAYVRDLIRRLHSITAREANRLDRAAGRKVWFQYWDSRITFEESYFARLRYVHENAVHHGIVKRAVNYPWCSAGWFERKAKASFRKTILGFPCDRVEVPDQFQVNADQLD
jgi:putative transposase